VNAKPVRLISKQRSRVRAQLLRLNRLAPVRTRSCTLGSVDDIGTDVADLELPDPPDFLLGVAWSSPLGGYGRYAYREEFDELRNATE
jgi:hypothetical protein